VVGKRFAVVAHRWAAVRNWSVEPQGMPSVEPQSMPHAGQSRWPEHSAESSPGYPKGGRREIGTWE